MRKHLILLLFIMSGSFLHAQKDVGGFLQVSLGSSFSFGEAGAKSSTIRSGFAKPGISLGALFGHRMYRNFGAYAGLSLDAFLIDRMAMDAAWADFRPGYTYQTEQAIGTRAFFTFGGQYNLNFKKTALNFRAGAASCALIYPEINQTITDPNTGGAGYLKRAKSQAAALGWNAGMSFRYEFKWCWTLMLNLEYYQANLPFSNVEVKRTDSSGQEFLNYYSYSQLNSVLQAGIGVAYVF